MNANRRRGRRWVVAGSLAAVVLAGSAVAGYGYLRQAREQGNRIKAVSCLRDIAAHAFMYANGSATQPAATQPSATRAAAETERVWAALAAGGHVVLLRHDRTEPGTGDPPGFDLQDPKTQRNLSDDGRSHAARLGKALADRGVRVAEVRSSQYARCLDTARLAFGGTAQPRPEPALNSLYADEAARAEQVAVTRRLIGEHAGRPGVLVLVTHQQNVSAVADVVPAQGEMVVVTPTPGGGFTVVGRLTVP